MSKSRLLYQTNVSQTLYQTLQTTKRRKTLTNTPPNFEKKKENPVTVRLNLLQGFPSELSFVVAMLFRDRSFFMREGGLVGFGGGHSKKLA